MMSETLPRGILVLGGARSGKSRHAEELVLGSGRAPVYIATAEAFDGEMRARIALHQARRQAAAWTMFEAPQDLPAVLSRELRPERMVLVDCLTLWLSNLLLAERDLEAAQGDLLAVLATRRGAVVLVSNEVGMGLVPDNALGRAFRDAQGRLNQAVAALLPEVRFVAAGLPLRLKPASLDL